MDQDNGLHGNQERRPWWKPSTEEIAFAGGSGDAATARSIGCVRAAGAGPAVRE